MALMLMFLGCETNCRRTALRGLFHHQAVLSASMRGRIPACRRALPRKIHDIQRSRTDMTRLPLLATVLGLGGLLPFLGCTVAILIFPSHAPAPRLVLALIDYGAVILSFLGAVHWGLALVASPPDLLAPAEGSVVRAQLRVDRVRLALGVLPALIGWAALLVPLVASPLLGLVLLALGFLGVLLVEARAARTGAIPPGYLPLRVLLTAVVLLCLLAVLIGRAV